MALRVRKSIKIAKGVRLNIGKKSVGLSFGTRGLRYSINSSGRKTATVGLPGTGISYTKSSGGGKRRYSTEAYQKRQQLQLKKQQQLDELQQAALAVEEYNNLIDILKGIHKECDDFVDWEHINMLPPPFNPPEIGPHTAKAIDELKNFSPGLLAKIFKPLLHKKMYQLKEAIAQAEDQDQQEYEEWQNLNLLSGRVLKGDLDAYFQVISEMNPLDDLLDFGCDFEFIAHDRSTMEVEFTVKTEQVVPNYTLTLTKTGKLSRRNMPQKQYYQLVQDYVCSCCIRIARDITALLPVQRVLVNAVDNILNTATGLHEQMLILSVVFDRDMLNTLNFTLIDPSDAMQNFPHHMNFLKTAGFQPVEKITVY